MCNFVEDIDVQDSIDAPVDTAAEDNADVDILSNGQQRSATGVELKSSPVQQKSGSISKGPLKSIMKKREERAREKIQRKESDTTTPLSLVAPKRGSHFKEFLELHVSKSPRHSVSMSSVVGATSSETVHAGSDVGSVRHGSASRAATDADAPAARSASRHAANESPVDPVASRDSSLQVRTPSQDNISTDNRLHETDEHYEKEFTNITAERADDTQL